MPLPESPGRSQSSVTYALAREEKKHHPMDRAVSGDFAIGRFGDESRRGVRSRARVEIAPDPFGCRLDRFRNEGSQAADRVKHGGDSWRIVFACFRMFID